MSLHIRMGLICKLRIRERIKNEGQVRNLSSYIRRVHTKRILLAVSVPKFQEVIKTSHV